MDTRSRHLLVELWGCDAAILDDERALEAHLRAAADAARVTIVQTVFHRFSPHGVTGVVVVEESHLSVHTWPESGYAAVDFFTCGQGEPDRAVAVIERGLGAQRVEVLRVERGLRPPGPGIALADQ